MQYVVVGAGLAGATVAERIATRLGEEVLVIEKKKHIGGLCYDCYDSDGILVHRYGPHIFHTKLKHVWEYLSQYTDWRLYQHRVLSYVDGKLVPIPINLDTVNTLFGMHLSTEELPRFFEQVREPIAEAKTSEDIIVGRVGKHLYNRMFKNYTLKQWGVTPDRLGPEVTRRIPIRENRDDRYFDDPYQGLPSRGYTEMVRAMLAHPKIRILLGVDYREILDDLEFGMLIYTGPLDYYFDHRHGRLPYRSLQLEFETLDVEQYQPVAVVNYPNDYGFTRITEFKHMTGQRHLRTTILKEFPIDANAEEEPCYPIPNEETRRIAGQYQTDIEGENNVVFVGRLAEYKYYNMDVAVSRALEVFDKRIMGRRS